MIKDGFIRKVIEERGMREITSSMVVEGERRASRAYCVQHRDYLVAYALGQQLAQQQQRQPRQMWDAQNCYGFLGYSKCPYCGK